MLQELESVQGELDILHGTKSSVTARKAELNVEMEAKLAKLDNEHKGMAVHIRRAESQAKIASDFRAFDEELDRQSRNGSDGAKVVQERLQKALQRSEVEMQLANVPMMFYGQLLVTHVWNLAVYRPCATV